jgi:glycosyltransferase involved in cell wall biosynthesis
MTDMLAPTFSVVIPVYNRAAALPAAIQSVLAQSDQDFEIVVVDDGSKDNPERVVEAFADPRIRCVRKQNGGGGSARNHGIDLSRGRFVAFLDSDDIFLPHHLANMRPLVVGAERVAGYARMIVDRGQGRTFLKPPRAIASGEHMATYLLCDRGFVPTITLVADRDMAARIRYDEALPFGQDMDFAIRLYLAGCRFAMADAPGAVWNDRHDTGRVSLGRKGDRLANWLEAMRPSIPDTAYHGARGWLIAKGVAKTDAPKALGLYLQALFRACYSPRLALVIFLQIFVPDRYYRSFADAMIALFRGAVWSRAESGRPLAAE